MIIFSVNGDNAMANSLVDSVVKSLIENGKFDPMQIGEHKIAVERRLDLIGLVNLKGEIVLHSTTITGLSKIKRLGDAQMKNENGSFSANLRLGDEDLKAVSTVTINVGHFIHPQVNVEVDIGAIGLYFSAGLGGDTKLAVKEFDIEKFQHVKFHVHGLILIDPLVDVIADAFVSIFNTQARHLLSTRIRPILDAELRNMTKPSS